MLEIVTMQFYHEQNLSMQYLLPNTARKTKRQPSRYWALLLLLVLVMSGCSESGPALVEPITLDDLPSGVGRGFPVATLHQIEDEQAAPATGALAPNFNMVLPDGKYLSLADLQGRPVLLNFWATWCGPCRLEMPELVAEANHNQDLVILAINVQEELTQLQPFAEDFQMTMTVVRDSEADLRTLYQVNGMPTSIFIDRKGNIATIWSGVLTAKSLQDHLAKIQ